MSLRARIPVVLVGLVALAALPLAAGFFGRIHPAFDALSHFRIHLAALIALAGLLLVLSRGWRFLGLASLALATSSVAVTLDPALVRGAVGEQTAAAAATPSIAPRYRLLQFNLRYDNNTPKAVLSLIGRVSPDVVTLEEVTESWKTTLALIEKAYPYRLFCPPPSFIGGVAILSRRPFAANTMPRCYNRGALGIAHIDFGGRIVAVAALHYGWPWPFGQVGQLSPIGRALRGIGPDALVAGDFNAVPWSRTVRQTARAGGLRIVRGIGSTYLPLALPDALRRRIGLPIDNILVGANILPTPPRSLPSAGSDHLPVLLDFTLEAKPAEPQMMQAMNRRQVGKARQQTLMGATGTLRPVAIAACLSPICRQHHKFW